jgi:ribose transport system ATP-binding protein
MFALQMKGICKSFPGVKALDQVDFDLHKGEVHILLGENGAGKSTLMKILSGVYQKDAGEILLAGRPTEIQGIRHAQALGMSMIHQELNLLMDRDIAQNIFLGREPVMWGPLKVIDSKRLYADSSNLLRALNMDLRPTIQVKDLSIAQQQMVEVSKAVSVDTKILIMDEPTSSLTQNEINSLFSIVRNLKERGIGIIYISHRMEEIFEIGDRVTVMRDGKHVGTVPVAETDLQTLVSMMVGRPIGNLYRRTYNPPGEEALRTERLCGLRFRNVDITVRRGEIVGLAGLVGAGRTELAKAIFGDDPITAGAVYLNGKKMPRHTPAYSVRHGLGLLPEDRKGEGLVLEQPIKNNISQASLSRLFKRYLLNDTIETDVAERYRASLRIASPDVSRLAKSLSGGNQQKIVLGKWLCPNCGVLIFDEPTRGIDIGGKADIYELMNNLARDGCAILLISSDQSELLGMSDRIYVMCEGEIVADLGRDVATPAQMVSYAIGETGVAR